MYLQILSHLFIFSALVVAVINHKYLKNTTEKHFVYYLTFVFVNEMFIKVLERGFNLLDNFNYNLFDIVSFTFFIFWFYKIINNKRIVKIIGVVYFIGLIVSLFFNNIFKEDLFINIYTGTLLLLILTVKFFEESLKSSASINFKSNPRFWIATGLLAFYIGYLPYMFVLSRNLNKFLNTNLLMAILCGILYGFFIKGFLCSRKTMK